MSRRSTGTGRGGIGTRAVARSPDSVAPGWYLPSGFPRRFLQPFRAPIPSWSRPRPPEVAVPESPLPPRPEPPGSPVSELLERARDLAAEPRVRAVALLLVAAAAGLVWFRLGRTGSEHPEVATSVGVRAPTRVTTTTTEAPPAVLVHVAGAVVRPGLVQLAGGARVADAIEAAGGGLPDADLDRLNLAALVSDGERVAVARVGQPAPVAAGSGPGLAGPGSQAGPIDLNTATQVELETLPGIGPTLAAAILATRERLGGFTEIEQLRQVRGIGELRFADLRELVTV